MWTEIILQSNCKIMYDYDKVRMRGFRFTYTTFNNIEHEIIYEIYFTSVDFKDKYMVKSFVKDDLYFDTFEEAQTYILKELGETRLKLNAEQEQIEEYIKNKKRRKKKNDC